MSTNPVPTTESLRDAYEAQCDQIARLREQLAAARALAGTDVRELRDERDDLRMRRIEAEATAERLAGALRRRACRRCQHLFTTSEQNSMCLAEDKEGTHFCDCKEDHRHDERARAALATHKSGTALAEHDKALTESLRARIAMLKDAIDRDRTGLAAALSRIIKEIRSRSWILEGRGAYEWDDDRYKEEAGLAMREAKNIADDALNASGKLAQQAYTATDAEVSAWLAEHDARVRKAVFEEVEHWLVMASKATDLLGGFPSDQKPHVAVKGTVDALLRRVRALTKEARK